MFEPLVDRVERSAALGARADALAAKVAPLFASRVVKNALSGVWLGHRLHPLLTDAVIGAWLSAGILDASRGESTRAAADRLVTAGVLAAPPTVLAGWNDWVDYPGRVRPLGLVHAGANTVALVLQVASVAARRRGRRGPGVALSMTALGALAVGGYLGGHLSYVLGAGVDRTAFQAVPQEWTRTVAFDDLAEATPRAVRVGDVDVVLIRSGDRVHALADTCNHLGCSLAQGSVASDGTLTCGCHGSVYRLDDGAVQRGPAASPQPAFATRVRDGVVEVADLVTGG